MGQCNFLHLWHQKLYRAFRFGTLWPISCSYPRHSQLTRHSLMLANGRIRQSLTALVTPQPSGLEGYCRHGPGGRLPNLRNPYLCNRLMDGRADWHGTKAMWIDRMLHPLCDFQHSPHPWPWRPWIFEVKFWKCCISGMEGPIDMEQKRCGSIGCYTHFVTVNIPLTHDLNLGFSRSKFEKVVSQEWDGRLTWNERDVSR